MPLFSTERHPHWLQPTAFAVVPCRLATVLLGYKGGTDDPIASEFATILRRDRLLLLLAAQNASCDEGGSEGRPGADTQRPPWTEVVGHSSGDRRAYRCSSQRNGYTQGHNPAPHRWLCRKLHDAVCAVDERGRADDHESHREPPDPGASAASVQPSPKRQPLP
jgi:hypothetical protein